MLLLMVGAMAYVRRRADRLPAPEPGVSLCPADPPPQGIVAQGEKPPWMIAPLPPDGSIPWQALAAPFKDGAGRIDKETPEFMALLSAFVRVVTPGVIAKAADPALTADAGFRHPADYRGRVMRIYGRLIRIYTERLDAVVPGLADVVSLGILQEYRTNRTVWVYLPGKPCGADGTLPELHEDWIEFEGLFLRRHDYLSQAEDEQGNPVQGHAAVLFAKDLRLSRPPGVRDWKSWFTAGVAGATLVALAIALVAGIMSRRYGAGSLRSKMREIRRARGIAVPVPTFPAAPDSILGADVSPPPGR
jgi:hypothetical protein